MDPISGTGVWLRILTSGKVFFSSFLPSLCPHIYKPWLGPLVAVVGAGWSSVDLCCRARPASHQRVLQETPENPRMLQEARGCPRRHQEAPGGPRRPLEAPGGPRRPQEAPGGPRRPQEAPGGPQEAPGGPRRPQEAPGSPSRLQEGSGSLGRPFGGLQEISGSSRRPGLWRVDHEGCGRFSLGRLTCAGSCSSSRGAQKENGSS